MNNTTICVLIMCKDEEHCILDTLNSTLPYTSEYIICDTGSTDNTIGVCNDFFRNNNIKGQIFQHEWKNFGYNYTVLYQLGYEHSKADYIWQIDADDIICGKMEIGELKEDAYFLKFGQKFTYVRQQISSNKIKWKHVGVIHGYIASDDEKPYSKGEIQGDYYIDSRRNGSRHKNIDKNERFSRDAKILEQGLIDEPNNSRYIFYLGQCYYDSEQFEKSAEAYDKRTKMGGWNQEIYYSHLKVGQCYQKLGKDKDTIIKKYLEAYYTDKERAEGLFFIGELYYNLKEWKLSKKYLKKACNIRYQGEYKLFNLKDIYDYLAQYYLAKVYFMLDKCDQSVKICKHILEKELDVEEIEYVIRLKNDYEGKLNDNSIRVKI